MLKTRGPEGTPLTQVLVFVNAKITCRRLARTLERVGINADAIHGDKTQEERQVALEGFKNGAIHVLVATDVAARGLDIKELPFVINYDVPYSAEDYVHRIGRTGRAGAKGVATMLATPEDKRLVEAIEALTKQTFKPISISPMPRTRRGSGAPIAVTTARPMLNVSIRLRMNVLRVNALVRTCRLRSVIVTPFSICRIWKIRGRPRRRRRPMRRSFLSGKKSVVRLRRCWAAAVVKVHLSSEETQSGTAMFGRFLFANIE